MPEDGVDWGSNGDLISILTPEFCREASAGHLSQRCCITFRKSLSCQEIDALFLN